jgi:WD40 repeat protein
VATPDTWNHPFRAFGFPVNRDQGVWASGVLRDRTVNGHIHIEDTKTPGYSVQPGFSGTAVWDETLHGVIGMVATAESKTETKAAFIIPTDRLVEAWPDLRAWAMPPNPYRGLQAFRQEDADLFFGREAFVEQLVAAVAHKPFVAVIGASGSGKSSVVFAGLLPMVRKETSVVQFRPGSQPFRALADALLPVWQPELPGNERLEEADKLAENLKAENTQLLEVVNDILQWQPAWNRLLLVADQFEELYTLCPRPEVRRAFVRCLVTAVQAQTGQHHPTFTWLLTMRADFMGQATEERPLADALQDATHILGPMTREELALAVEKPAQAASVQFEPGLIGRILDDVGDEPGNLPLLEFALTLLWDKQTNGLLTHANYEAIGEVEGALARYAEEQFAGLTEAKQAQARLIFTQLVQPGRGTEDTRRQATVTEIGAENWGLVKWLADARLVVTNRDEAGEETAEIVHEVLTRRWQRLRDWMNEDRRFREWQERLREARRQWQAAGKDDEALLRGTLLAEAEGWLTEQTDQLPPHEQTFINESVAFQKRALAAQNRRRNIALAVSLVAAVLFAILGLFSYEQSQSLAAESTRVVESQGTAVAEATRAFANEVTAMAERAIAETEATRAAENLATSVHNQNLAATRQVEAEHQAALARSNEISLLANAAVANVDRNSILLALEAVNIATDFQIDNYQAYIALYRTVTSLPLRRSWSSQSSLVWHILFLDNTGDSFITAGSASNKIHTWNNDGQLIGSFSGRESPAISLVLSPHKTLLGAGGWGPTVELWNTRTEELLHVFPHANTAFVIGFSQAEDRIVTASINGTITIWNTLTGDLISEFDLFSEFGVVFTSIWDTPLFIGQDEIWVQANTSELLVINLDGQPIKRVPIMQNEHFSGFDPEKNLLVSNAEDKTLILLRDQEGNLISTLNHQIGVDENIDVVEEVLFDVATNVVVTLSEQGIIRLWNTNGDLLWTLSHLRPSSIAISSDGQYIGVAEGQIIYIYGIDGQQLYMWANQPVGTIRTLVFTPDNKKLIAADEFGGMSPGLIHIWEFNHHLMKSIQAHGSFVADAAIKSDDSTIVTIGNNGEILVWNSDLDTPVSRYELPNLQDILRIEFSPDETYIAVASRYTTYLLDEAYNLVADLRGGFPNFSPISDHLLTQSGQGSEAYLYDLEGSLIASFGNHSRPILTASFSPDGQKIVTGNDNGIMEIWDLGGNLVWQVDHGRNNSVFSAIFNKDGTGILSTAIGQLHYWDIQEQSLKEVFDLGILISTYSMDFERYLIQSSGVGNRLALLNAQLETVSFLVHSHQITASSFDHVGDKIVTGDSVGTVKLWDRDGNLITTLLEYGERISTLKFSNDGTFVIMGASDGTIHKLLIYPELITLQEEAIRLLGFVTKEGCYESTRLSLCNEMLPALIQSGQE